MALLPDRTLTKYRDDPILEITLAAFNAWSTDLVVKASFYGREFEYVACYIQVRNSSQLKASGHAHVLGRSNHSLSRAMILAVKSCGIHLSEDVETADREGMESIIKAIGIALGHDPYILRIKTKQS